MKLLTKLAIFLELKNHSYSKRVDLFIRAIIEKGEFVGENHFHVHVRLYGKDYFLWGQNKWYADLSECNHKDGFLYCNKRPSRFTQIRFWEWVEKHKPDILDERSTYEKQLDEILQREE